jgi:apolipoprotein N-acyltransferase
LGLLLVVQNWTGIYVGNLPYLALVFMQAIFFLPLALVGKRSKLSNAVIFGCALVLSELLMRTTPFTGFGWSRLGFTQVDSPLSSIYPLMGAAGVAFLIGFLVAIRKISQLIIVCLFIIIANFLPTELNNLGKLEVALVQGGVPQLGLDFNSTPLAVYQNHYQVSRNKLTANMADLVIWPENSVDIDIFKNPEIESEITELSDSLETPILVGGISRFSGELQNISVFFNPKIERIYVKRYLTPFGEYIPMRSSFERFSPYVKDVVDFSAGTKKITFKIDNNSFQTLICYEIINDTFRDELTQNFLVVQTNNATFGDTAQLDQQLNIAKIRAIETGREIAYVSTTGVTSFIDTNGDLRSSTPKFGGDVLIDDINLYEGQTLTQKLKFYPEIAALLLLLLLTIKRVRS